jgi:hypothetical protein
MGLGFSTQTPAGRVIDTLFISRRSLFIISPLLKNPVFPNNTINIATHIWKPWHLGNLSPTPSKSSTFPTASKNQTINVK